MDLRSPDLAAEAVVAGLGLSPHPEGGFYRETFRDGDLVTRGAATAILFLLPRGVVSHWHHVDAVEIWLWQGGAPLLLEIAPQGARHGAGRPLAAGAEPGRVDAGVLHRGAGVPFFRIRDGRARLAP
jgi:predicted cupin superfamily sugar epimerase